ncbi:PAS-domain containing protein [Pararhodobacter aggregans]|uniref:histidine kinase n=1 Tax=Pararhodobacter aggregans TaxID=404875 RepID=A0A2T7UJI0_9RHOB|nr:PAS-domain containing protein [Pararhodobacter aggregans]PTW96692.1 PAS domain S-box-containing protein [Pararhodobacter aggregans]PVE44830.1 hybrid sensor histidine kinase/response regulator [Pararhodobacter aggregans]
MQPETHEKLTRAGLNLIQQALSIFDSDLRLAVCNPRYQEMFGLPDALVRPGASFEETIRFLVRRGEYGPPGDVEEAVRLRVETARDFRPHYMERQRANGRWVSVEGAPLAQGGWVTVYTDITEIKLQEQLLRARSEELSGQLLTHAERLGMANRQLASTNAMLEETQRELREMEARTRLVTEMMPAHIAHLDRNLVYTYSNRRLSSLVPGLPANVVGMRFEEAVGPQLHASLIADMHRTLQGEDAICELTHEDSGRRIRVVMTPDPRNASDGQDGGVYLLTTDITAETQARAALMQTRKREVAAQLTSGLAHDFSNLLTIILGLQDKLARLPGLPSEAAEAVRATQAAARRGGTLLRRIGEMSGARVLNPQATDLEPLLDDLRMMASPSLPAGMRLSIALEPGLGRVMLDQGATQDALLNLILNARDAIGCSEDGGGQIRLSARRVQDTWLELAVEDDGPGFTDEALKRGLDPFYTTKGAEGSGLGLAMVYDQASLAGGTVRLANRPEGGARVTLRLPLRPAADPAPDETRLVLLVEDSAEIRMLVREMLVDLGHRVIEAETAEDARALALLPEIGMVLSDIQLKGEETGPDLLARLRGLRPGLAMALMTSLPPADPLRARAAQEAAVLAKPFAPAELDAFLRATASAMPGGARPALPIKDLR